MVTPTFVGYKTICNMKKKDKLSTPKWKLFLKRLKYMMFTLRPIPLLKRKKCGNCNIIWNPELFTGCPLCGRGPNKVWIVTVNKQIHSVYRDPDDAKWTQRHIKAESDETAHIEDFDIQ